VSFVQFFQLLPLLVLPFFSFPRKPRVFNSSSPSIFSDLTSSERCSTVIFSPAHLKLLPGARLKSIPFLDPAYSQLFYHKFSVYFELSNGNRIPEGLFNHRKIFSQPIRRFFFLHPTLSHSRTFIRAQIFSFPTFTIILRTAERVINSVSEKKHMVAKLIFPPVQFLFSEISTAPLFFSPSAY